MNKLPIVIVAITTDEKEPKVLELFKVFGPKTTTPKIIAKEIRDYIMAQVVEIYQ